MPSNFGPQNIWVSNVAWRDCDINTETICWKRTSLCFHDGCCFSVFIWCTFINVYRCHDTIPRQPHKQVCLSKTAYIVPLLLSNLPLQLRCNTKPILADGTCKDSGKHYCFQFSADNANSSEFTDWLSPHILGVRIMPVSLSVGQTDYRLIFIFNYCLNKNTSVKLLKD